MVHVLSFPDSTAEDINLYPGQIRRAQNGWFYTWREYVGWYGNEKAEIFWDSSPSDIHTEDDAVKIIQRMWRRHRRRHAVKIIERMWRRYRRRQIAQDLLAFWNSL